MAKLTAQQDDVVRSHRALGSSVWVSCGCPAKLLAKFPAAPSSLAALQCEAEGAELDFLMAGLGNIMGSNILRPIFNEVSCSCNHRRLVLSWITAAQGDFGAQIPQELKSVWAGLDFISAG